MRLNINIDCEVSDDGVRQDILHMLETTLPYMADNVATVVEDMSLQPTRILDRLAEDPNDYNNRDNRAQAHLINKMRLLGFRDSQIYQVVNLLIDAQAESER